jgi:bifunctional non-homologous end joining protein LigD
LPLIQRKDLLKNLLDTASPNLQYSDHFIKDGEEVFKESCRFALEGIISKRIDSSYSSRRSKDWLKIKCLKRQEFVIGGYTSPQGSRTHFGALLLGVYNKKGELHYAGNVGTGFNQKTLNEVYGQLVPLKRDSNPFNTKPPDFARIHWVHPKLVAEIEFTEWTKDGHLRHPSFKGLRRDKKASEVVHEQEIPIEEIESKHPFVLSNPHKILYPQDHISKEDLLIYYEEVSEYILPFLTLRPLTLVRCPSHYRTCFYQRHYNKSTPKSLLSWEDKNDKEQYIYLNNKEGLLSLVQMGVLEIHPWNSKITHLEQPDLIVFDLDPAPDVPWKKVVEAALDVRDHLSEYQLTSFVRSTGGKGLHVVLPIKPEYKWEQIKEFTHVFAQFLEQLKPNHYISTMTKSKRNGKIFIDYLRNQRTATAIASYSTRAKIHAPVSTPLAWEELSPCIEDNIYTIKTLPKRLKQLKEDPWKDFWVIKQSLRLDEL